MVENHRLRFIAADRGGKSGPRIPKSSPSREAENRERILAAEWAGPGVNP
jgi:hypothetical protein